MSKIDELVEHIEGDVDRVSELLEHVKAHIRNARHLYESGTPGELSAIRKLPESGRIKELSEIGDHLLQIDSKIHELYHHIAQKETGYDPDNDITVEKAT